MWYNYDEDGEFDDIGDENGRTKMEKLEEIVAERVGQKIADYGFDATIIERLQQTPAIEIGSVPDPINTIEINQVKY
jgi:hypothetical protein